jgi:RNA polymerase sigma-32 factor
VRDERAASALAALSRTAGDVSAFPARSGYATRPALLGPDEESRLVRLWRDEGNESALHALILAHTPLVARWARHYRSFGVAVEDLVQEGHLGLLKAAERFDPGFGIRFSGYAGFWVRSAIRKHVLGNRSMVARTRVARASEEPDGTPRPTWPMADVSLNQPAGETGEERERLLADEAPTPEERIFAAMSERHREKLISEALEALDQREVMILRARWLTERRTPLAEVGRTLKLTGERVRQLERRALARLAASLRERIERTADLFTVR